MLIGFITDIENTGLLGGIIILIILGIPTFLLYKKAFQKKVNHTPQRTYERTTYSALKNIDTQRLDESLETNLHKPTNKKKLSQNQQSTIHVLHLMLLV